MAKALRLPANNPLLLHAEAKRSRWLTSITCKARPGVHPTLPAQQSARPASDGNPTTPNWAGYVADTPSPDGTFGTWYVPEVAAPTGDVSSYSSVWTGIGGFADPTDDDIPGQLIQAGTEEDSLCPQVIHGVCSDPTTAYYAWYEQYPYEDQIEIANMTVSPGDDIAASAGNFSSSTASFLVCDDTTNVCAAPQQATAGTPGDTSEWVVERTLEGGSLPGLAPFGTTTFEDGENVTWFEGGVATTPEAAEATPYDMYNGSDLLASTGELDSSGEGFTVTYVASE